MRVERKILFLVAYRWVIHIHLLNSAAYSYRKVPIILYIKRLIVIKWVCARLNCWKFYRLPNFIFNRSGRTAGHIGTEINSEPLWRAAVGNIGQWTKVWSSDVVWRKRRRYRCKLPSLRKIMTYRKEAKSRPISVPAAAVIQGGQALFVIIGRTGYVGV